MQCLRGVWENIQGYFYGLLAVLGKKFLAFLVLVQHLMKGFLYGGGAGGLVGIPILFLFRSYTGNDRLSASQMQVYKTAALTPWALKSLFGLITDTVYIGGHNKMPYMVASTAAAALACLILACAWPLHPALASVLLFFAFAAVAIADLLTEAKYSEKNRLYPERASDVTTFVWAGIFIAQLLSTLLTTAVLDNAAPHWVYLVPVLPLLGLLYPMYQNWIGEPVRLNRGDAFPVPGESTMTRIELGQLEVEQEADLVNLCGGRGGWFTYRNTEFPAPEYVTVVDSQGGQTEESGEGGTGGEVRTPFIGLDREKVTKRWRVFVTALVIMLISITTFVMGLFQVPTAILFATSLLGAVIMIIAFNVLIGGVIARIQTFVIIQNMFTISVESATFFFFTDDALQYPEGPHFSIAFYVSVLGIVGSICAVVSVVAYQIIMKHWKYRSVLIFNNLVYCVVSLLNVVLFRRWNVAWGIPDTVFVLGAEVFQVIIGQWTHIPMTILMSSLCPKGVEATMFALLAGSSNLGASLAQYQGAFIMEVFGINPRGLPGESAAFSNLWKASLISTLVLIIPVALIPFLIPDSYQTEAQLEPDEDEEQKHEEERNERSAGVSTLFEQEGESTT